LINCREAEEQGKTFDYAWFLLSILLVVGELSEDSQFPHIDRELPEAAKYTSLWASKDAKRIGNIKIFWLLMEVSIWMWINRRLHLSPMMYKILKIFAEFKADIRNIYIRVQKDPMKQWMKLPFIATDNAIFIVLETWPPEWRAPDLAELEKAVA